MIFTPGSSSSLKRFDFFEKAVDDVRDTSVFGAIVSVLSIGVLLVLVSGEVYSFLHGSMGSKITVTTGHVVEETSLNIHITFPGVDCNLLKAEVENIRGGTNIDDGEAQGLQTYEPTWYEWRAFDTQKYTRAEACTLKGTVNVARVGGEFRVRFATTKIIDSTHYIHDFSIGNTQIPGQKAPLKGSLFSPRSTEDQRIIYDIQAVPVTHIHRTGITVKAWTYAAMSDTDNLVHSSRKMRDKRPGIDFAYDFSPLMVYQEEEGQGLLGFLTGICAIAGGVCTVARFLVGFALGIKHSTEKRD